MEPFAAASRSDDVGVAVRAGTPPDVGGQRPDDKGAVADQHEFVTAPAAAVDMSLPGLEHHVDVSVLVESADHHEVVTPVGAHKRRNQRRDRGRW